MATHRSRREGVRRGRAILLGGALAWMLAGAQLAQATPVTLSATMTIPAMVQMRVSSTTCTNTGSSVDITGAISLGKAYFHSRLANNLKNTKTATNDQVGDFVVDPTSSPTLPIPKQPVLDGVGGNPWISVELATGTPYAVQFPNIGRCVQGVTFDLPATLVSLSQGNAATVAATSCTTTQSTLGIGLGNSTPGITATVVFSNNKIKSVHDAAASSSYSVEILSPRDFTKGVTRNLSGAGGNPYVYGTFFVPSSAFLAADGNGDGIGDVGTAYAGQTAWGNAATTGSEFSAGRCRDLLT